MQKHEWIEQEKLWVVRYISQSDLAALPEGGSVPLGHALFRAGDEEQVRQKLTAWLHLVLHEEAIVESVELLPADALKRLSVRQARKARRACQGSVGKPKSSLTRRGP
jgi:hypothetical protein